MAAASENNQSQAVETALEANLTPLCQQTFCKWPGAPLFRYFLKLGLIVGVWFKLLFNGSDYITGLHTLRYPVAMSWEVSTIPFVPEFTLLYSSIYLTMLLLPFVLRSKQELRAMAWAMITIIGISTLFFLIYPTEPAYGPLPSRYPLDWLHSVTKLLALQHNLAPSLHVAMSWIILRTLATKASRNVTALLMLWAAGIAMATLLTHQHHVVDVITGWALAELIYRLVYRRRVSLGPASERAPAMS